jgi:hypothetical protein
MGKYFAVSAVAVCVLVLLAYQNCAKQVSFSYKNKRGVSGSAELLGKGLMVVLNEPPVAEYLTDGQTVRFSGDDRFFTAKTIGEGIEFLYYRSNTDFWTLRFSPPPANVMAAAANFAADSAGGADRGQIVISNQGRTCEAVSGQVKVLEILRDDSGNITSLALEFEHGCLGLGPPLRGSLRFNSSVPVP